MSLNNGKQSAVDFRGALVWKPRERARLELCGSTQSTP